MKLYIWYYDAVYLHHIPITITIVTAYHFWPKTANITDNNEGIKFTQVAIFRFFSLRGQLVWQIIVKFDKTPHAYSSIFGDSPPKHKKS